MTTSRAREFDAITVERLRESGRPNWTTHPDMLGAFVAEMDLGTAPTVTQAIHAAVDNGLLGYVPRAVADRMSAAAAEWFRASYGWDVEDRMVHPVADVLKTVEIAIEHYSRPGSPVIIPTPAYMNFFAVAQHLGREVLEVPLGTDGGRAVMDLDALDAAFRAGGGLLLLCNPLNPVGRVFERAELVAISEMVARHGGRVFADEVHAPMVFDGAQHVPYASVSDEAAAHTVTGTSAAKAWNLAGMKCAQFITSNDADEQTWSRISRRVGHGASSLGVIANTAAYATGRAWLDSVLAYISGNRLRISDLLDEHLPEVVYSPPEGTFVAWLDCRALELDMAPASFFKERAGVALIDGATCGAGGDGFVRLSFATARPILEEMVLRMGAAVRQR